MLYSVWYTLQGKYADIPTVSEAVYIQARAPGSHLAPGLLPWRVLPSVSSGHEAGPFCGRCGKAERFWCWELRRMV